MNFKMSNNNQNKIKDVLRLIILAVIYGMFGWVYFMGIVCPIFNHPFIMIYRGIGIGMLYPLYSILIPIHINKIFPDARYSGAIVSVVSIILALILLFTTYPLNVL